ncbi:amino acid ABC transporter substrate-binding protein [Lacihabitans sp. LS3-19]|uniref:ABC transporter substrate-binding protein n=1 Tax=Lacihabitans sp. LS3-19 TaxID=2487335 RepID=UPI0020CB8EE5|nr:ABC transporter substrate-binding protein [Lacihabitans sp. LS3-19]MCP9766968.1 amino acid ABC transporter substrate-binding protein [Lacihabitans sp. LS3-19]
MKKTIIIIVCFVTNGFAQLNDQAYLIEYKKAVQLFANSNYEQAGQKFNQLASRNYSNPMVPYAYFYNALNSKNKGNLYQSRIIFRNLFESFYDWDKINEARILYADLNFSENYFEEALKSLETIQDPAFDSKKNAMLKTYIPKIKSVSTLKELYFKFPSQKILAENLVEKIQSNRYNSKDDLEISDMLTNRFKLSDKKTGGSKKETQKYETAEGSIDFGVLLPFNLGESEENRTSNQYVYDLYEGMKIAAEQLVKEGMDLNLHAFDVKKTKYDFQILEKRDGFKNLDLFFGPLYPEPNNEAKTYAASNKIIQVHPLSNNLSLLKDEGKVFLMQPSYTQQSKKTLDYALSLNRKKSVSIYFGTSRKDSLFASIYKSEAQKRGFTITSFKKYSGKLSKLSPEAGHIFLATDNNDGVKFLQSMTYSKIEPELICTATSFSWDRVNSGSFAENVSFIYPEFVAKDKETVRNFEDIYFEKMGASPSYYSYAGYDMVLFFGKMLKNGKDIFDLNIDSGQFTDDYLLGGFDFSGKIKENAIVPIVKYKGEAFEEIYR